MTYIPKSKVNILDTPGGQFIKKSTNQEYTGKYLELSNGKFYVGTDPSNLGEELITPFSSNQLGNDRNSLLYSNLKPKRAKFLSQTKSVYPSKTSPTDKDNIKGHYSRYFARKVNEPMGYMEVDVEVFNSISKQKKEYDFNVYEVGSTIWNLNNNPLQSNYTNLKILERTFPFISLLFPKLDEFEIEE
jgi:hypothetical protein